VYGRSLVEGRRVEEGREQKTNLKANHFYLHILFSLIAFKEMWIGRHKNKLTNVNVENKSSVIYFKFPKTPYYNVNSYEEANFLNFHRKLKEFSLTFKWKVTGI